VYKILNCITSLLKSMKFYALVYAKQP